LRDEPEKSSQTESKLKERNNRGEQATEIVRAMMVSERRWLSEVEKRRNGLQ